MQVINCLIFTITFSIKAAEIGWMRHGHGTVLRVCAGKACSSDQQHCLLVSSSLWCNLTVNRLHLVRKENTDRTKTSRLNLRLSSKQRTGDACCNLGNRRKSGASSHGEYVGIFCSLFSLWKEESSLSRAKERKVHTHLMIAASDSALMTAVMRAEIRA